MGGRNTPAGWFLILSAFGAGIAKPASAQVPPIPTAQAVVLDEIIVTARKVPEPVQEVPMSIQALPGDLLQATAITDLYGLQFNVPGLIVNNSFKGYDEFARLALRAPYSRPSQALWFTHPEHGITAHWQVYLEDLKTADKASSWVLWQK